MRKATITRTWLTGIVAIALGLVAAGVATGLMLAYGGTFTASPTGDGYDFTPYQDGFFWSMVGVITLGGLLAVGGAIVQFVAWIAAVINASRLEDKTWFLLTLVLGLLGFGLVIMIVYLLAAPDGYETARVPEAPAPRPTPLPAA
jgi:hypothetical protein